MLIIRKTMASVRVFNTSLIMLCAMALTFMWQMNSNVLDDQLIDRRYKAFRDVANVNMTQNDRHPVKNSTVYIVYYRFGKQANRRIKEGQDLSGCIATYNESLLPRAKAVVIRRFYSDSKEIIPRYPNQIFVFLSSESPPYVRYNEGRLTFDKFDNGFINWTMTYRSDSDIFNPYIKPDAVRSLLSRDKVWVDENLSRKRKIALWMVSDCNFTQRAVLRMEYAKELIKAGLPLTTYGECFGGRHDDQLLQEMNLYKFYLAFENALHCKDYITEKFWRNGLLEGMVPVVWGPSKEDVKKLAPPDSYIHTEDFDSPASLASYLLYLDKNDTAYREYFRWLEKPDSRREAFAKMYESTRHERLCEMVLSGQPRKTIDSITDFVYAQETEECLLKKPNSHR